MSDTAISASHLVRQAIEAGEGILRLAPTWVPRSYLVPGRRLKLDLRDLYAYGTHRGGIDERWLVPPRILHAPRSLRTYEPQWGSDVLSIFQSRVDGRQVARELLVQDVPIEQ